MKPRSDRTENGHIPSNQSANGKKLSLWPLSVEEAAEAFLRVPPMPKDAKPAEGKEKAPPKRRLIRKLDPQD
jgi:hypothetical protein